MVVIVDSAGVVLLLVKALKTGQPLESLLADAGLRE